MHTYFIMCKNQAGGESKDPGMKCVHFILNAATVQMLQVESGGLEPRPSVSFFIQGRSHWREAHKEVEFKKAEASNGREEAERQR